MNPASCAANAASRILAFSAAMSSGVRAAPSLAGIGGPGAARCQPDVPLLRRRLLWCSLFLPSRRAAGARQAFPDQEKKGLSGSQCVRGLDAS